MVAASGCLRIKRVPGERPYRAYLPASLADSFAKALWQSVAGLGHAPFPTAPQVGTARLPGSLAESVCGVGDWYADFGAADADGTFECGRPELRTAFDGNRLYYIGDPRQGIPRRRCRFEPLAGNLHDLRRRRLGRFNPRAFRGGFGRELACTLASMTRMVKSRYTGENCLKI